jgi:hypothetical protein
MREITQEYLRELFAYDPETGELTWLERPVEHFSSETYALRVNKRFAGKIAGNVGVVGYRRVNIANKFYLAHRLIWLMVLGRWPDHIDHINGQRDDNRLANLRAVDATGNSRNLAIPSTNTSGVVGVSYCPRDEYWHAYIGRGDGGRATLGYFKDKDAAIAARRAAEVEYGYHPNHGTVRAA